MGDIIEFIKQIKSNKLKDRKKNEFYNLVQPPKKEKSIDTPHIRNNVLEPNVFQMGDILYLPTDAFGYKYVLSIVDVYTNKFNSVPLKSKNSSEVAKALKKLYSSEILEYPEILQFDRGSEFQGEVKEFCSKNKIFLKYALTNRHRQQALIEAKNKMLGNVIMSFQAKKELENGKRVKGGWVKQLPELVKYFNSQADKKENKKKVNKGFADIQVSKASQNIIPLHSNVRRPLDYPIDAATGKRNGNSFRTGDLRYDPKIRTVEKIILNPYMPPMYMLDGKNAGLDLSVAYTKQQLQIIDSKESKTVKKRY